MLDYKTFSKAVMKNFTKYLPEPYNECSLELRAVPKTNEVLTGIVLKPKTVKGSFASPTFYMERLWKQYEDCGDFEKVMQTQAVYLKESLKELPDIPTITTMNMKNKVVFQIVNKEKNREMLSKCPHRDFFDLAIVYRVIVNADCNGVSGFLITNEVAEAEHFTESELYECAYANTPNIFPFTVERIEETMIRMMKRYGASQEEIDDTFPNLDDIPNEERVYVVTNKYEFFGFCAILFEDFLRSVADKIGKDCYILPSSVHDFVILSTDMFEDERKSCLAKMVRETNADHVRPCDVLSDSIYFYSYADGTISLVKDTAEEESA